MEMNKTGQGMIRTEEELIRYIKTQTQLLNEEEGEFISSIEAVGPGTWDVLFEELMTVRIISSDDGSVEYYLI